MTLWTEHQGCDAEGDAFHYYRLVDTSGWVQATVYAPRFKGELAGTMPHAFRKPAERFYIAEKKRMAKKFPPHQLEARSLVVEVRRTPEVGWGEKLLASPFSINRVATMCVCQATRRTERRGGGGGSRIFYGRDVLAAFGVLSDNPIFRPQLHFRAGTATSHQRRLYSHMGSNSFR
jgi:hypothetical protein